MMTTRPPESESTQTTRIRWASLVVILASLLAKALLAGGPLGRPTVEHLLDMLLDALVIAGIVAYLGETRIFKSYLEDRLRRYAGETADRYGALLAKSFLERATDERALRAYDRETLRRIERSVQRASLPDNPHPEIDQLLAALNNMRERVTIWRTGWTEYLTWLEYEGHDDLCLIKSDLRMNFINGATDTQTLSLAVSDLTFARLDDQAKLYKLLGIEFDNKPLTAPAPTVTKDGGRTTFETTLPTQQLQPTPQGGTGTPFRQQTEVVYSRRESRSLEFSKPVKGFELILQHPPGLGAEVVVFGIGGPEVTDPLPPVQASATQHHWKYSGWLLESSGVILTFTPPAKK
jgi:hypothetical protein